MQALLNGPTSGRNLILQNRDTRYQIYKRWVRSNGLGRRGGEQQARLAGADRFGVELPIVRELRSMRDESTTVRGRRSRMAACHRSAALSSGLASLICAADQEGRHGKNGVEPDRLSAIGSDFDVLKPAEFAGERRTDFVLKSPPF